MKARVNKVTERAFTITELLVTLVVVCCMVLMVIPVLGKNESRGLTTACRSNLRLMMGAFHMYADENNSYFAPNDPTFTVGQTWISDNYDLTNPATNGFRHPRNNLLLPYLPWKQNVMRCPGDQTVIVRNREFPRLRSISMNHAVGTKGSSGHQRAPVDGGWLTADFSHTANSRFYCYGKLSDIVAPTPGGLWVFIEEHPDSINDGAFGNVGPIPPNQYRMIDFPGSWHDRGSMLSFADGHVEERKWVDARTVPVQPFTTTQPSQANNVDITWLANRTTAPVQR